MSATIKFTNYGKQVPIQFKIYADTECFLKWTNSHEAEHIIKYQEHYPNPLGAKLGCTDNRFTLPLIIFKGDHCVNKFIKLIFRQQKQINRVIMTTQDEEIYNNSQICWRCTEDINTDKVRDHFHITGKFRGAAHNQWNLKLKIPKNLPIIFHNLEGYDRHIIFTKLFKK